MEVEIDFLEQPYDVEELYELLGLPGYISRAAATTARNRSPREGGTRTVLNFWTLHSGLTSALTHDFSGSSEVGSLETYSRIARDMLWNPGNVVSDIKTEWERQQRLDGSDDEETVSASWRRSSSTKRRSMIVRTSLSSSRRRCRSCWQSNAQ